NENDDVREITRICGNCANRLSSSSDKPSEKYAWSPAWLMSTKGSTAIEGIACSTPDGGATATRDTGSARRAGLASERSWKYQPSASAISAADTPSRRLLPGAVASTLTPSGVISKTQAITSAIGNPRATSNVTRRGAHGGSANCGSTVAATWI